MTDLPNNEEMLLYAERNLEFFIKTLHLHFYSDIELLQASVQPETEEQRLKRLISEKESFFQSGLVILFNSTEIYLRSIIAEHSVHLLLKEVKDCYKNKSPFECSTLDATELRRIVQSISGRNLPPRFNETYDISRKERDKVIRLGKSNNKRIRKDFLSVFLIFREEICQELLNNLVHCLINDKNMPEQKLAEAKKNYATNIMDMMKTFFSLDDILANIHKIDGEPKDWNVCTNCQTSGKTLAVIFKTKSICLSCDFKIGL